MMAGNLTILNSQKTILKSLLNKNSLEKSAAKTTRKVMSKLILKSALM